MLEIKDLTKSFGGVAAVDTVSFRAGAGETVGLLGPNGAGKTTTVSMIAGLLRPDAGSVLLDGRAMSGDTDPLKREIGLAPQDLALIEEISAFENLALFGALYGMGGAKLRRAAADVLEFVGLAPRARAAVRTYSGGMKRRLNMAAALLHDPQLLLLDEPTVGVDPQSRNSIFDNLEALKKRGKTVIYTTHYMEEAERLCDRVVIMDHGRVVADDTLHGLHSRAPAKNLLMVELNGSAPTLRVEELQSLDGVVSVELRGESLRIGVRDLSAEAPRVLQWLTDHGQSIQHVASERASLESMFLTLTGRSLRDQ
jgi:ABC-2 type transport system ATP-binding protein